MTRTESGLGGLFRAAPIAMTGLVVITLACWVFFFAGAGTGMSVRMMSLPGLPAMGGPSGTVDVPSGAGAVSTAFMWWTMMIAMMMPGTVRRLAARPGGNGSPSARVLGFSASYAAIWLGFSVAATVAQFLLAEAGLLHGMLLWSTSPWFSAALLGFAGAYQFTGLKTRCLTNCHAVPSGASPLRDGAVYGLNCLVSSVPLMLLLYVGGVMNAYWVVLLTVIVTVEKTLRNPKPFSAAVGAAGLLAAVMVLIAAI